mmetsp:Transcript_27375/g.59773  ORF Transcript_27375/g.59773 Transcript_27375/m.59773 type:complete len:511 (+) Transcript_27375:47-1579(+)
MASSPRTGHESAAAQAEAEAEALEADAAAPLAELWERLFVAGLALHLDLAETRRSFCVCREWQRLGRDTVSPEQLWSRDLGRVRRGIAWKQLLLGGITLRARSPQDDFDKLCETPSPYDSTIQRDVGRTFPSEELFRQKGGKGQTSLFRLLRALSIRLWDIGYCQSLNFIVATLIAVFPDDEAAVFHCALALLLRHSLVDLYRPSFAKLGVVVWQFDRIVEGFLPKVHSALEQHGVNSEFYGIQWFMTLFASDLQQAAAQRVWDRFLIAGWQVVVQVGLALLYKIQDVLPTMDTCHALSFLRRFVRTSEYDAEELLSLASSFDVTHQMLSAVEAAYSWEGEVQLLVVKDLNIGQLHWRLQAGPAPPKSPQERRGSDGELEVPVPRAFSRAASQESPMAEDGTASGSGQERPGEGPKGSVLPFLLHNLDTGRTEVMERPWKQYTREMRARARAAGAASAAAAPNASVASPKEMQRQRPAPAPLAPQRRAAGGGSFWMQSVQQQAARRLSQT